MTAATKILNGGVRQLSIWDHEKTAIRCLNPC